MKKREYSVPALQKGLAIMEMLAQSNRPLGVTDIYEISKIPKSTIFMILTSLEELNYLQKMDDGKYGMTLKLYNIGLNTLTKLEVRNVARPIMDKLADQLRFTVHLAILENNKAIYIEKVKGPGFVQFSTEIGQTMNLHNSEVGKVLAAYISDEILDRALISQGMPATTPNTITDQAIFNKFLANVRESGYAIEDEEGELGIRCIAAPIYDYHKKVIAAISVTALRNELPSMSYQSVGELLKQHALEISAGLGYRY